MMVLRDREAIGKRIKFLRKKENNGMGMTLEEWSALFNSKKNTASQWERGTIPYKRTLDLIAERANVSPDWILYGDFKDYVVAFMKSFESLEKYTRDETYISDLVSRLESENRTYGDYKEILGEIFKLPTETKFDYEKFERYVADNDAEYSKENVRSNPGLFLERHSEKYEELNHLNYSFDTSELLHLYQKEDIQKFMLDNEIENKDLKTVEIDNVPEFRFELIDSLNKLLTSRRKEEYKSSSTNELWISKNIENYDVWENLRCVLEYLEFQEYLFKDKFEEDGYYYPRASMIQASIRVEQNMLRLMTKYLELRCKVAQKHELDLKELEKKVQNEYKQDGFPFLDFSSIEFDVE